MRKRGRVDAATGVGSNLGWGIRRARGPAQLSGNGVTGIEGRARDVDVKRRSRVVA
jgi:hypothetical protein